MKRIPPEKFFGSYGPMSTDIASFPMPNIAVCDQLNIDVARQVDREIFGNIPGNRVAIMVAVQIREDLKS